MGVLWERRRSERTLLFMADQSMFVTSLNGNPPFREKIVSMVVNAHGGLVRLHTKMNPGEKLVVWNARKSQTALSQVVWTGPTSSELDLVAFEFESATPEIWPTIGWPKNWSLIPQENKQLTGRFLEHVGGNHIGRRQAESKHEQCRRQK